MNKILVIEDSKEVLSNIVIILELNKFSVLQAEDGLHGLEIARKEMPDLILSDIMMPKLDGLSMLELLRQDSRTQDIPIIFLTAKVDNKDIRRGMIAGADDYIFKPFRSRELIESINTQLEKKKRQQKFLDEIYNNISSYIPHELRTPLVSIYGYTDLMMTDLDSIDKTEMRSMLCNLKNSAQRLHRTLEKFIKYSESELMIKDRFGYNELKNKYVVSPHWLIHGLIEQKNYAGEIRFKHDVNPDDLEINIYIEHFRTIIDELLNNAIKFSPSYKDIEVTVTNTENEFDLSISNFGLGMTKAEISRISPFVQHKRNSIGQDGNGLGLVLVKKLCEFYDADFQIHSEPDVFTKVEIKFPARVSLTQGIAI